MDICRVLKLTLGCLRQDRLVVETGWPLESTSRVLMATVCPVLLLTRVERLIHVQVVLNSYILRRTFVVLLAIDLSRRMALSDTRIVRTMVITIL